MTAAADDGGSSPELEAPARMSAAERGSGDRERMLGTSRRTTALRAMGTESMLASSIIASRADFFTSFGSEEEEEEVAIFGVLEFGGRRRDERVRMEIGGTGSLIVWCRETGIVG